MLLVIAYWAFEISIGMTGPRQGKSHGRVGPRAAEAEARRLRAELARERERLSAALEQIPHARREAERHLKLPPEQLRRVLNAIRLLCQEVMPRFR